MASSISFLISKKDSQRCKMKDRHKKSPTLRYCRFSLGIASGLDPLYNSLRNKVGSNKVLWYVVSYECCSYTKNECRTSVGKMFIPLTTSWKVGRRSWMDSRTSIRSGRSAATFDDLG